jgi:hypothetical protein
MVVDLPTQAGEAMTAAGILHTKKIGIIKANGPNIAATIVK